MSKVIEKHLRISRKKHRLHHHLSSIPAESVSDEMLLLMELGLLFINGQTSVGRTVSGGDVDPSPPAFEAEPESINTVNGVEIDDFDISDAMFTVFSESHENM
jgi:hypothetical protein